MSTTTAPITIPDFAGRDVVATSISIRNTGHGLEKAMEVDPAVFDHEDTVYVVLKCEVEKIRHDLGTGDNEGCLVRHHMLVAGSATFVEKSLVDEHLSAMETRIEEHDAAKKAAKDKAKAGDGELNGQLDLEAQQHELDHQDGKHADLVDGCEQCDAEKDAIAAEAEPNEPQDAA